MYVKKEENIELYVTLLGGQDDYDIVVSDLFSIIRSEKYKNKHNAELQRVDPGTKVTV